MQALDERLPRDTSSIRRAAWARLLDNMPRAALGSADLGGVFAWRAGLFLRDERVLQRWRCTERQRRKPRARRRRTTS
jgi:hypothetical protein